MVPLRRGGFGQPTAGGLCTREATGLGEEIRALGADAGVTDFTAAHEGTWRTWKISQLPDVPEGTV